MKILIGTQNKSKLKVVKSVFESATSQPVEVITINSKSGVADAPWNEDTYKGAQNRARECSLLKGAQYFVGLESGLTNRWGNVFEETWAVVIDTEGREYVGYSSGLKLPDYVTSLMENNGITHDQAMKIIDQEIRNDNYSHHNDTWGTYSGGTLLRSVSLSEALRNAVIQAVMPGENSLYQKNNR